MIRLGRSGVALLVAALLVAIRATSPGWAIAIPSAQQSCLAAQKALEETINRERGLLAAGGETTSSGLTAALVAAHRSCFADQVRPSMQDAQTCDEHSAAVEQAAEWALGVAAVGIDEELAPELDEVRAYPVHTFRTCYRELIEPGMAAMNDCATKRRTLDLAQSWWLKQVEFRGIADQLPAEVAAINDFTPEVWVTCFEEAYLRCVERHDLTAVTDMRHAHRQLELLGAGERVEQDKIERCLTFELVFESRLTDQTTIGQMALYRSHVRAVIPLRVDQATGAVSGEGSLEYLSFEREREGCRRVVSFGVTHNARTSGTLDLTALLEARIALTLELHPGMTTAERLIECGGPPFRTTGTGDTWGYIFYSTLWQAGLISHEQFIAGYMSGTPGLKVTRWTYVGQEVVARADLSHSFQNGGRSFIATTTAELRHAPRR